jgi:uncharacterized membrane protein
MEETKMKRWLATFMLLLFIGGAAFGCIGCKKKAATDQGTKAPAETLKDQQQKKMDEAMDEG